MGSTSATAATSGASTRLALGARILRWLPEAERRTLVSQVLEGRSRLKASNVRTWVVALADRSKVDGYRKGKAPVAKLARAVTYSLSIINPYSTPYCEKFLDAWCELNEPLLERARQLQLPPPPTLDTQPPPAWSWAEGEATVERLGPFSNTTHHDAARFAVLLMALGFASASVPETDDDDDELLDTESEEELDGGSEEELEGEENEKELGEEPLDELWLDVMGRLNALPLEHRAWSQVEQFAKAAHGLFDRLVAQAVEETAARAEERARAARAVVEEFLRALLGEFEPELAYLELDCSAWTALELSPETCAECTPLLGKLREALADYRALRTELLNARTKTVRSQLEPKEDACAQGVRGLHDTLAGHFASAMPPANPGALPDSSPTVEEPTAPAGPTQASAPVPVVPPPSPTPKQASVEVEPSAAVAPAPMVMLASVTPEPPPAPPPSAPTPRTEPPVAQPEAVVAESPSLPVPAAPAEVQSAHASPPKPEEGKLPTRASEAPAAPRAALRFSEHIASWKAFSTAYWVNPEGLLEEAPWQRDDFADKLQHAAVKELSAAEPRFWRLWPLAAAAASVPGAELPGSTEVQALGELWSLQSVPASVRSTARRTSLVTACSEGKLTPSLASRTLLFLEAAAPSVGAPLARGEALRLAGAVGWRSKDLESVVAAMLDFAGYGENPIERFRALPQANGRTEGDLRSELTVRRQQFHEFVIRHWKSCGGKAPRPHCRHAWSEFIEECAPLLRKLYPPEHNGLKQWGQGELTPAIANIETMHRKHADRRGANWEDRASMDRVVARIAREAADIDALMLRLVCKPASTPDVGPRGDKLPLEALRRLLDGEQLSGDEEFYRRLLMRLLRARPDMDEQDLFSVPLAALCRTPDLLLAVPHVREEAGTLALVAFDFKDVRLAAALLLDETPESSHETSASIELLIELLNTPERQHLLTRLVPLLPTAQRERVHAQSGRVADGLHAQIADLHPILTALSELASPLTPELGRICREAEELVTSGAPASDVPPSPTLMHEWLGAVKSEARSTQNMLVADLEEDTRTRSGEEVDAARQAIQRGQYALALGILRGAHINPTTERRATLWRQDARARFPNPARLLREPAMQALVPRWTEGIGTVNHDRAVRTEFARLFLGELYEASPKAQHEVSIACADIRQEVEKRGLNPSYLPQLNHFGALVIPNISLNPASTNFVPAAAAAAARSRDSLVLLLAPGITDRVRQSLIEELVKRKVTAAVVDDLDLCRLLNPDQRPDPILGVLEILLEQQRWSAVTPFRRHEGQHVQLEMYVGRAQEARDLAVGSDFSRLFSGRKMGKSALLRFVESRFDGRLMPDRTQLRVVYVSAVGIEQPSAMVDRIIEAMTMRLRAPELTRARAGEAPGERLDGIIRQYLMQNENVSLLLVLDEADTFVEQELEEYEVRKEACLSFLMRSKLMELRSPQGLPRVRFVFTGYRVTNTNEGAWGNWGKVLKLAPLQPDDAAGLVAGPLARLGVDATDQAAAIAHRCGYQPAVILSFCERLLTKLEERWTPVMRLRSKPTVTAQDVAATFEDTHVQEEIRAVAKNNFQGNTAGRVVFSAALNEFLSLSSTQGLTDAEARLRERLDGLCAGDWSWLRPEGETVEGELTRHLRDMVDRQLLISRRGATGSLEYLLKFPHHLTVLAPLAQEEVMRVDIRALRQARTAERGSRAAQALLSRHRLQGVRDLLDAPPVPPLVGVPVVGALWPAPLFAAQNRDGALLARGLFDRLGLDASSLIDIRSPRPFKDGRLVHLARVAIVNVAPSDVPTLLADRSLEVPPPLLVGGADLLRATLNQTTALPGLPGTEVMYETYGVGRLSRAALAWWFERARGVNFVRADAIDLVQKHTSGIPLLVAELDRVLLSRDPEGSGLEVSDTLLTGALDEFERALPRLAKQLRKGPPAMRLEAREIALLEMFTVLTEAASKQKDVYADLTEYWPIICEAKRPEWLKLEAYRGFGDGDAQRLGVLQQLGLLPTRPEVETLDPLANLAPVEPEDAVLRLARALLQEE